MICIYISIYYKKVKYKGEIYYTGIVILSSWYKFTGTQMVYLTFNFLWNCMKKYVIMYL